MKGIMLRMIGLQMAIGELCDLARQDQQRVATELLNMEPRLNKVIEQIYELLAELPLNDAPSIFPT